MIKELILQNYINIIIVVGFVGTLIALYRTGHKKAVNKVILRLTEKADEAFDSKECQDKLDVAYMLLPKVIRWFYSKDDLCNLINEAFDLAEKKLKEEQ